MAERAITRVQSLREWLDDTLKAYRNEILTLLSRIEAKGKGILQHHQIVLEFEAISEETRNKLMDGGFGEILKSSQVIVAENPILLFLAKMERNMTEIRKEKRLKMKKKKNMFEEGNTEGYFGKKPQTKTVRFDVIDVANGVNGEITA